MAVLVLAGVLMPLLASAQQSTGEMTQRGRVHVVHVDGVSGDRPQHDQRIYLITDDGDVTELLGAAGALDQQQVVVRGRPSGASRLHVSSIAPVAAAATEIDYWQMEPLIGEQHWLTVLCEFPDSNPQTWRPIDHFDRLLSDEWPGMGHYFNEVSYGAVQIVDPVVTGWYMMPQSRDAYFSVDGYLDQIRITEDCATAADADVNYTTFDGINLVFNDGLAGVAMGGSWSFSFDGQSRTYPTTWLPDFGYLNQNILAHEMGHAFGLPHSSGPYDFTYDSMWDIMSGGGTCNPPHPDYSCVGVHPIAVHKDMLGWIPAGRRFIADSPSRQTIEIERLAQPDDDGYLIGFVPIQGSLSQYYTIEARRRVGYDVGLPAQDAIVLHRFDLSSYDQSSRVVDVDGNGDVNDDGAIWLPGETFQDEVNRISITVESATDTSFTVTIDVSDAYGRTWERTDKPVSDLQVDRTWMWGPESFTGTVLEPYVEGVQGDGSFGLRAVRYFDKSRMEITDPRKDPDDEWYVTNGLLVVELVTGRLQLGDNEFDQVRPAEVNVAGDADDPVGPTYATFGTLLDAAPYPAGSTITTRLNRDGTTYSDPALATMGVTAAHLVDVPGIRHQIASPFWEFLNASGLVYDGTALVNAPLFEPWFYATGYPISEAYWATVEVGKVPMDVLMQCFERRCLTYTPGNPVGWKVEAGNVGRHYYTWRYERPEFEGRIAYVQDHSDAADIYVIEPGDDAPRNLTNLRGEDTAPAWSPDGSRIAFTSTRGILPDVFVMDADGTNVQQLTFGMNASSPAWSPDGSEIVFSSISDIGEWNADLWIVSADGGEPRQLTTSPTVDMQPDWSPDGETIVYASNPDQHFDLYTINVDGTGVTRITDHPSSDLNPAWSPDGDLIAFERDADFNGEIYVADADGGNVRNLTNHEGWDSEPTWSPDGSMIAYSTMRRAGGDEIYVMNADGSDQRNLTIRPGADFAPDWGP